MGRSAIRHPVTGEAMLTTTQAAQVIGVSRSTLNRMIAEAGDWGLEVVQVGPRRWHYITARSADVARSIRWPAVVPSPPAG